MPQTILGLNTEQEERPVQVLLVEDDIQFVFLATRALQSYKERKFEIQTVENGADALLYLRTNPIPPDIILLDMIMPVMNGIDFLEAFADLKFQRKQPLVFILSTMVDVLPKEIKRKVTDHFDKPLKQKNIAWMLEALQKETL